MSSSIRRCCPEFNASNGERVLAAVTVHAARMQHDDAVGLDAADINFMDRAINSSFLKRG